MTDILEKPSIEVWAHPKEEKTLRRSRGKCLGEESECPGYDTELNSVLCLWLDRWDLTTCHKGE
jgi:hypothetical protein